MKPIPTESLTCRPGTSQPGFATRALPSQALTVARVELPTRTPEGQQPWGRAPRQDQTEPLQGMGTGPSAPASNRTPVEGGTANLKRPRRLPAVIVIGSVACLLGVGPFKAVLPQAVSIGGSSCPTPTALAAASTPPSPIPSASQASPKPSPSGADWLAEAKRYLDSEDYTQALPPLRKAAGAGDTDAMRYLGLLYENGQGGDRDYDQACQWFRSAAEAGNADAMVDLGYLYEFGWGVTRDYNQARQWFQEAADAGNAAAKQALLRLPSPDPSAADWFAEAKRYLDAEDYALALAPLRKAAEAGNAEAMNQLGELYYYGYGVDEDFDNAREWYRKAAEAGNPLAREALSRLGSDRSPVPVPVTPSSCSLR